MLNLIRYTLGLPILLIASISLFIAIPLIAIIAIAVKQPDIVDEFICAFINIWTPIKNGEN